MELAMALKRQYEADEELTVRQLAAMEGRSYGSVHRLLCLAGANMRPRGGDMSRSKTELPPFPDTASPRHIAAYEILGAKPKRIFRGLAAGRSIADIATEVDISKNRVISHISVMTSLFGVRDQGELITVSRSLFPGPGDVAAMFNELSTRRKMILRAIANGHSAPQIGDDLHLHRRTISAHIAVMVQLFGAGDRVELAAIARSLFSPTEKEPRSESG